MGRDSGEVRKGRMRPVAAARMGTQGKRDTYYNRIREAASPMENLASDPQIHRHTLKLNNKTNYQTNH